MRRRSARSGAAVPHIIKRRCHCGARAPSLEHFGRVEPFPHGAKRSERHGARKGAFKTGDAPHKRRESPHKTRAEEKGIAGLERRDDPPQRAAGNQGRSREAARRAHRRSEPKGARPNQEKRGAGRRERRRQEAGGEHPPAAGLPAQCA